MGMNTDAVQRLYVAYFNRPADPVGLAAFEALLPSDREATQEELLAIAGSFSASQEYADLYAGMSNTQIVNALYNNLFGRDAEPAGLIAWAQFLQDGTYTIADIALQLTYSAQGTDADAINAKISAATAFTAEIATSTDNITGYSGNDAAASARSWLATVTDEATASVAIDGVEAAVEAAITADSTPVDPVATFALAGDVSASNEGTTVYFTLTTENVAAGSQYSYTLSGTNITNGDVDGSLAGTATIDAEGKAVVAVDLTADQLTEGLETMTMSIAGQTASVNINDTSTTPAEAVATYALAASASSANEGDVVVFTLTTTNVASGSLVAYAITGIESADVVGGALTGTATVGVDGVATVSVSLTDDASTEGAQTMTMTMAGQTASVSVADSSGDAVKVMTLTTGADGGADFTGDTNDDIFSGAVGTLNTVDSLDGGNGNDTLNAVMNGAATPTLTSVESMTVTATGASTIDLLNSDSLTTVNSSSSTAALTLNNAELVDTVTITNTDQTHTINFEGDTGTADAVTINMTTVTGAADLVIDAAIETVNMASEGTNSFETDFAGTIDLSGSGSLTLAGTGAGTVAASVVDAADYTGALTVSVTDAAHTVTGGSAGDTITGATGTANTLTGNGGNDTITGGTGADNINAGEGANTVVTGGGADTVNVGAGNDTITDAAGAASITDTGGDNTVTAGAGNDTITTGAGDDRIIFAADNDLDVNDQVDPGAGTNTLVATAGDVTANNALNAADPLTDLETLQTGFANFDILEVSDAMANTETINTAAIGAGILRVDLTTAGAGANNFILNAGDNTINANMAGAAFAGAVTITDTGTATTDSVTLVNNNAANADRFGGQNLTVNGFETLNVNGGATAVATAQTIGTVTMAPDGTNNASVINVSGNNAVTIGAVTQTGTGLLTINGSTVTAQTAGTTTLDITAPVVTTGGASIVGSAGDDTITGDTNNVNTIDGGAGDDTLTGGSAADSITATAGDNAIDGNDGNDTITTGAGADTITGGTGNETVTTGAGADVITTDAGNDSVNAGDGNDRITAAGNLTTADTLDGGADTDTLVLGAVVTAGSAVNLSSFETIEYTAAAAQDMFLFGSDNTINTLVLAGDANFTFTNVADTTNSIVIAATMTAANVTSSRLVDGTANGTTISIQTGTDAAQDLGVVTISNEETVTLNTTMDTAGRVFDISGTLDAADMTSLTITGNSNVDINAVANAAGLATLNSADLSGTLVVGSLAAVSTVAMTVTTGAGASTVTSGSGDDTLTAGDGAVVFSGDAGADTVTGGAGADSLSGAAGNDVLSGGAAADSLVGGAGDDTVTGGAAVDHFQLTASTDGTDTWVDWTDGEDLISIADAVINPAGTAANNVYVTGDYEDGRNTVADIVVGDTLHVIELQNAQSTAQIQTVAAGGAADAVVIVFNSTTGKAEIWYDDDWSDAAGRTQLATLDNITTLAGVTALTFADIYNGP